MGMLFKILVVTQSKDVTVDYLISTYSDYIYWFRINVDQLDDYQIQVTNEGVILAKGNIWSISSSCIDAVYYRKISLPDLSSYESHYIPMMQRDIMNFIEGIVETFDKPCITKPSILRKAENKIVQLNIASSLGFQIPQSLITNDEVSAYQFCQEKTSIVKPLSTGRVKVPGGWEIIQTNVVNREHAVSGLSHAPSYFQTYVEKSEGEYRVTIVGRTVYAVRIDSSNTIDWRRKNAENFYQTVEIPIHIIELCYRLMDELKITFGAFDFIKMGDEYYFLEVNPNGQWLWLEEKVGIPISQSIINQLIKDVHLT